jgi:hypothetical protein
MLYVDSLVALSVLNLIALLYDAYVNGYGQATNSYGGFQ